MYVFSLGKGRLVYASNGQNDSNYYMYFPKRQQCFLWFVGRSAVSWLPDPRVLLNGMIVTSDCVGLVSGGFWSRGRGLLLWLL